MRKNKQGGLGRAGGNALNVRLSSIDISLNEMNWLWTGLNENRHIHS
jgi:hypothetical protein